MSATWQFFPKEKKRKTIRHQLVRSEFRSSEESRWEVWQQQQQQKWCRDGSRIFPPILVPVPGGRELVCCVCVCVRARGEVVVVGTGRVWWKISRKSCFLSSFVALLLFWFAGNCVFVVPFRSRRRKVAGWSEWSAGWLLFPEEPAPPTVAIAAPMVRARRRKRPEPAPERGRRRRRRSGVRGGGDSDWN